MATFEGRVKSLHSSPAAFHFPPDLSPRTLCLLSLFVLLKKLIVQLGILKVFLMFPSVLHTKSDGGGYVKNDSLKEEFNPCLLSKSLHTMGMVVGLSAS